MKFRVKPWHIVSVGVVVAMLAYVFVMVPAIEEMKEVSAARYNVNAPNVPDVVVLTKFDSGEIRGVSFFVKSTNNICHLTTTDAIVNGALDCRIAQSDTHKLVLESVNAKL